MQHDAHGPNRREEAAGHEQDHTGRLTDERRYCPACRRKYDAARQGRKRARVAQ